MTGSAQTLEPGEQVEFRWRASDGAVAAHTGAEAGRPLDLLDLEAERPNTDAARTG
jgi:hypothetical protein